jgi:Zn-dependent protease with chaperone function
VLLQLRLQILLALVPILMIMALRELIEVLAQNYAPLDLRDDIQHFSTLAMAVSIFLFAPLIARSVLDVRPIAPGPLRQSLLDVCTRHRVKARELLIWNTNGTMINAAVMGLIGPLRYVMITDALLESLPEEQVRAVMAHEIGHVRRRHMPWLVVCLMAAFAVAGVIIIAPLWVLESNGWTADQQAMNAAGIAAGGAQLAIGLLLFGWVCRRFERQADTFAVQHLSGMNDAKATGTSGNAGLSVQADAVHAMCDALESIARLNTINIHRPSWRHGSIAWRMNYLMSIIGRPVTRLPIDRMIRWIKLSAAVALIGIVGAETWFSMQARAAEQARREQTIENIERFKESVLATLRELR